MARTTICAAAPPLVDVVALAIVAVPPPEPLALPLVDVPVDDEVVVVLEGDEEVVAEEVVTVDDAAPDPPEVVLAVLVVPPDPPPHPARIKLHARDVAIKCVGANDLEENIIAETRKI